MPGNPVYIALLRLARMARYDRIIIYIYVHQRFKVVYLLVGRIVYLCPNVFALYDTLDLYRQESPLDRQVYFATVPYHS
jgi:hypothetical protein